VRQPYGTGYPPGCVVGVVVVVGGGAVVVVVAVVGAVVAVVGAVVVVVVGVPKGGFVAGAVDDGGLLRVGVFTGPISLARM
jgi:hypothetical protein